MSTAGMRTLAEALHARCLAPSGRHAGIGALLCAAREWLAASRRDARDRDAFSRMSDRELRDIGVDRGSIEAALHRSGLRGLLDR